MKYLALTGNCPKEAIEKLSRLPEIEEVIPLPEDNEIDSPIKNHPDTILCVYGKSLFLSENYYVRNEKLISYICSRCSLTLCAQKVVRSGKYPFDCSFNAFVAGNFVFGNKNALCGELAKNCIHVNQGYAACSSIKIGNTVITNDKSISCKVLKCGFDVFVIQDDDIILKGYNKGFIGGSGGSFENTLCLFGSSDYSYTCKEIEKFCIDNNFRFVSLCDSALYDFGGIKFIPVDKPINA